MFGDHLGRLNEAVIAHLSDGLCAYTLISGAQLLDVPYQLDLDYEVYDQDQLARRVRSILVPVERVPGSSQGDQIVTLNRTWMVEEILEDDGYWRRLWVS
ncbi:unnamed protein product [Ectocarpus sp. 12 AP-2014]